MTDTTDDTTDEAGETYRCPTCPNRIHIDTKPERVVCDDCDIQMVPDEPLQHLRRAIDAAAGEWTREEEILRGAHDDILAHREGQTDD